MAIVMTERMQARFRALEAGAAVLAKAVHRGKYEVRGRLDVEIKDGDFFLVLRTDSSWSLTAKDCDLDAAVDALEQRLYEMAIEAYASTAKAVVECAGLLVARAATSDQEEDIVGRPFAVLAAAMLRGEKKAAARAELAAVEAQKNVVPAAPGFNGEKAQVCNG
jgi:hypothetical protein